jgi:DsbC/DsbD-like thiol-disulfide interchange protein
VSKKLKSGFALLLAAFTGFALPRGSKGQSGPETHAKVELIADGTGTLGQRLWAGVLFRLDVGWHVYWENAGDSGTPPKVAWQLPAGYRAGAIRWPAPVRLGHGSIVDYGYEGEVLLMAPLERGSNVGQSGPDVIAADVRYVVCRDVCIPGKAHLRLTLPPPVSTSGKAPHDEAGWDTIFERTRAELPKPIPATWKVSASSDKDNFLLAVRTRSAVQTATFFPLDSNVIENSAPQSLVATANGFRLTLRKSDLLTQPVSELKGVVQLGPQQAYEIAARVTPR